MKHVFIINPICLPAYGVGKLVQDIKEEYADVDYDIHITTYAGEEVSYARDIAKSGDNVRLYACGGDGTVSGIADAIYKYENAELAVVPIGTGNDLVRYFGKKEDFLDLHELKTSFSAKIDLVHVEASNNDKNYRGTCINITNIGFDEKVVSLVAKFRKCPLVRKSFAYTLSVFLNLVKYPMETIKLEFDDGTIYERKFLLAAFANASYYGGGYYAAPRALIDDGIIDVLMVKPIGRLKFISMVGDFKAGNLFNNPAFKNFTWYKRCTSVKISKSKPFSICVDGNIFSAKEAQLSILPGKINFVVPNKCINRDTRMEK